MSCSPSKKAALAVASTVAMTAAEGKDISFLERVAQGEVEQVGAGSPKVPLLQKGKEMLGKGEEEGQAFVEMKASPETPAEKDVEFAKQLPRLFTAFKENFTSVDVAARTNTFLVTMRPSLAPQSNHFLEEYFKGLPMEGPPAFSSAESPDGKMLNTRKEVYSHEGLKLTLSAVYENITGTVKVSEWKLLAEYSTSQALTVAEFYASQIWKNPKEIAPKNAKEKVKSVQITKLAEAPGTSPGYGNIKIAINGETSYEGSYIHDWVKTA